MPSPVNPEPDQRPAESVPGHGQEIRVGEPPPDRQGFRKRRAGSPGIAGNQELLDAGRDQHIAPLDAVRAAPGQEVARPRQPAPRLADLSGEDHAVRDPEGKPGRPRHILQLECLPIAARQRVPALRFLSHQVGRNGLALQVVKRERRITTEGCVSGPGRGPALPSEGLSRPFQRVSHSIGAPTATGAGRTSPASAQDHQRLIEAILR
jgi:hypothetical protein